MKDDGKNILDALKIYASWKSRQARDGASLEDTRSEMIRILGKSYTGADLLRFAGHIVQVVDEAPGRPLPTTDDATLAYLRIQKQCFEWAIGTALDAGGRQVRYEDSPVDDPSKYRPGMALFVPHVHAMIITDIRWDATGKPVEFEVAEANAETLNWANPKGQIPWARTVRVRNDVSPDPKYHVVSFE